MLGLIDHLVHSRVGKLVAVATIAIVIICNFDNVSAQQPVPKIFPSSEAACEAFLNAVQKNDQTALLEILGPTAGEIISGGNDVEDRNSQQQFVEKYRQMHRLVREPNGTVTLYVGAENWPLPILMRHKADKWYFDPVASKQEILFRRIGRNESETIEVCRELVDAEKEYYTEPHDGGVKQYAARFLTDGRKHDGLYWEISAREQESPVGQLLARANTESYEKGPAKPQPFHGYYYRILNRQGRHARGGARDYLVGSKMTGGGFAFLAYPAEYRSSGVMTFIVNQDGVVFQKDLGPRTVIRAKTLNQFDPDATWKKVE